MTSPLTIFNRKNQEQTTSLTVDGGNNQSDIQLTEIYLMMGSPLTPRFRVGKEEVAGVNLIFSSCVPTLNLGEGGTADREI